MLHSKVTHILLFCGSCDQLVNCQMRDCSQLLYVTYKDHTADDSDNRARCVANNSYQLGERQALKRQVEWGAVWNIHSQSWQKQGTWMMELSSYCSVEQCKHDSGHYQLQSTLACTPNPLNHLRHVNKHTHVLSLSPRSLVLSLSPVSYTHLTLPTNREV